MLAHCLARREGTEELTCLAGPVDGSVLLSCSANSLDAMRRPKFRAHLIAQQIHRFDTEQHGGMDFPFGFSGEDTAFRPVVR